MCVSRERDVRSSLLRPVWVPLLRRLYHLHKQLSKIQRRRTAHRPFTIPRRWSRAHRHLSSCRRSQWPEMA